MRHVIGIDQGGSGTRAVVCGLDGQLLGVGLGPGGCHSLTGMPAAMEATLTAVKAALSQAALPTGEAEIVVGGYTGADWPDEYELLKKAVQSLNFSTEVHIVNDSIAALRGGTEQPYGAILVAGSGANCAVRAPDGREFIYHYYHDDNLQGGSAIGKAALHAIFRAETGRPPQTSLRKSVLAFFKLPNVNTLMRDMVEGRLPTEQPISMLAPIVFREASKGDEASQKILIRFGEGCAELLSNGLRRLEMTDLDVEVVISGGIFKTKNHLLFDTLSDRLLAEIPLARLVNARYEPCVGAALLAIEKAKIPIKPTIITNIMRTSRKLGLVRIRRI